MTSNRREINTVGFAQIKSRGLARLGIPVAAILACSLLVAACTDIEPDVAVSEPDPDLNFVRGYRSESDPCQLTGETDFTAEFLDDASDLVTCLTGDPAASSLLSDNGAIVVTQTNSFTLYSVPRR